MHINDTDLISVGLHMKTVKQITGIWLGKQARMVMMLSVTHRKNILFPAQTPENAVGFVLAEHTNHPDVRAVACIGLTDGLAVREKDGKDAVGIPLLRRRKSHATDRESIRGEKARHGLCFSRQQRRNRVC